MLPNELLHAIISCLLEEPDSPGESLSVEPPQVGRPLRATGLACCLVSRGLLPHGRRILYSQLDNRDAEEPGDFALLVARLLEHPHLARHLRVCIFRIGLNVSISDARVIEDVSRWDLGNVMDGFGAR